MGFKILPILSISFVQTLPVTRTVGDFWNVWYSDHYVIVWSAHLDNLNRKSRDLSKIYLHAFLMLVKNRLGQPTCSIEQTR